VLKVRIFKIDIRISVPCGRQVHQSRPGLEQRSDAVHEDKVPKVIRTELPLKAIDRFALGARHHTGVRNNQVERLTRGKQPIGATPHTVERCQVQLDQIKTTPARRLRSHLLGSCLRFG
jgi:hypothetical protein